MTQTSESLNLASSPDLANIFQDFNPKFNHPIAPFTTWKIGGPAEVLIQTENSNQLLSVLNLTYQHQIPFTILGNGSNILISDSGIKGLVIINRSREMQVLNGTSNAVSDQEIEKESQVYDQQNPYITPRHNETGDANFYSFEDLDYKEEGSKVLVKIDSGVLLPIAISWSLSQGLSGLQWFSGIPGSMGGSLYNNIHGGTRHLSDYFVSATIWQDGEVKTVDFEFFGFGYDQSILRTGQNIIVLDLTLNLIADKNIEKARFVATEWAKRKRIQPKRSCGSVFQCLTPEQQKQTGFPTPSIGYIVDKQFNWRGKTVGDVQIADQHGNFIINKGEGKAKDVLELIRAVKSRAKQDLGLEIHPEINFLGFTEEEIAGIR